MLLTFSLEEIRTTYQSPATHRSSRKEHLASTCRYRHRTPKLWRNLSSLMKLPAELRNMAWLPSLKPTHLGPPYQHVWDSGPGYQTIRPPRRDHETSVLRKAISSIRRGILTMRKSIGSKSGIDNELRYEVRAEDSNSC